MNYSHFGDAPDSVKRDLIQCLAPCGEWFVHPMFTDDNPAHYAEDYYNLLNAQPAVPTEPFMQATRDAQLALANDCQGHLFFDPDTGLCINADPPRLAERRKFLMPNELVNVARARPDNLTLVYDQSLTRNTNEVRQAIRHKLQQLTRMGVCGLSYYGGTNVSFVLISQNPELIANASGILRAAPGLPAHRMIA